ncbi:MAG TPA: DUF4147 domain-containing protein [Blastocatellia bacterium]|nr:DUF4147 domain-containing protein [Blastocatellia bacterium]
MSNLKEQATRIFLEMLKSIEIEDVINRRIKVEGDCFYIDDNRINLHPYEEIVLIGFGKASVRMGEALEKILGERIKRGILVCDRFIQTSLKSEVIVAGHPIPDFRSVLAAKKIIDILHTCDEKSLVIFLISGGGSSLVELPLWDDLTVEDMAQVNSVLVHCGASIREINIVRKHLSCVKGGRLGYLARKAACVALFVSDVNPGDLHSLASNPLQPDDVSLEDFFDVIDRFDLRDRLPHSVSRHIIKGDIMELPKDWSGEGHSFTNILLLENEDAIKAAAETAANMGFQVEMDFNHIEGPYSPVADDLLKDLLDFRSRVLGSRICLVSGGEVSCPAYGNGIGGRNQEFVLYSCARLVDLGTVNEVCILSCGTDGIDGNSNAAGAVADYHTIKIANMSGLEAFDFINKNDSHSFFKQVGGLVVTGPTGNNVRDIRLLLAE